MQFERFIFFVFEERLRFFSGSASFQGSDSLPRILIRRRRLRSMESFRIRGNSVLGRTNVSFSPPSADADKIVDRAGRNSNAQMFAEKLSDLAVCAAFSSQGRDNFRMRVQLGSWRLSGRSSNNLLIIGSIAIPTMPSL